MLLVMNLGGMWVPWYVMLENTFTDYCLVEEEILMNIKISLYLIVIRYSEELSA